MLLGKTCVTVIQGINVRTLENYEKENCYTWGDYAKTFNAR